MDASLGERSPTEFGCLVSEAGGGNTWAVNSGESVDSWLNDRQRPMAKPYLRTKTGDWSPTSACREQAPYLVTHEQVYNVYPSQPRLISRRACLSIEGRSNHPTG
jgi:hypothetical protein